MATKPLNSIETDLGTAQSDISTAQSDITTAEGNIGTLQSDLTTAEGNITTLQGEMTTAQGDISTNTSNIATKLPLGGGTLTGNLLMGANRVGRTATSYNLNFPTTSSCVFSDNLGNYTMTYNSSGVSWNYAGALHTDIGFYGSGNTLITAYQTGWLGFKVQNTKYFYWQIGTTTGAQMWSNGFYCDDDNQMHCGATSSRWIAVWAVNGTIQTSDETKKNITDIGDVSWLYDLTPFSYRWKDNTERKYFGFSAQDVYNKSPKKDTYLVHTPEQKKDKDGNLKTKEDGSPDMGDWGMKMDELIPPMLKLIQEQKAKIDELETRLSVLESA